MPVLLIAFHSYSGTRPSVEGFEKKLEKLGAMRMTSYFYCLRTDHSAREIYHHLAHGASHRDDILVFPMATHEDAHGQHDDSRIRDFLGLKG